MVAKVNVFDEISNDAGSRIRSRDWYLSKIKELQGRGLITKNKLQSYGDMATSTLELGNMYMFSYDPKYKETLPWYDAFPIVIPFSHNNELFTGFNLHYLPPAVRWTLLKALLKNQDIASVRRISASAKMKMDYQTLKASTHIPILKPTFHSYLFNHVVTASKGAFLKIHPSDWHVSVLLPVQSFKSKTGKVTSAAVWKNSMGGK